MSASKANVGKIRAAIGSRWFRLSLPVRSSQQLSVQSAGMQSRAPPERPVPGSVRIKG